MAPEAAGAGVTLSISIVAARPAQGSSASWSLRPAAGWPVDGFGRAPSEQSVSSAKEQGAGRR